MGIIKSKKNNGEKNNISQDNTTKQIAFFGFYLVFFIVVVLLLKSGLKNNNKNNSNITGYGYDYQLTELVKDNYHFVYKENVNENLTVYEGDLLNNDMLFNKSGNPSSEYYISSDKTYVKDNNFLTWSETNNPIMFKDFIVSTNIQKIINRSEYIYRNEYMKDDLLYFGYTISNNQLRRIFETAEIVEDEGTNNIVVVTDKKGNIKSINFELTNYFKQIDPNITKYTVLLNYSKYNEIKEITNPIN